VTPSVVVNEVRRVGTGHRLGGADDDCVLARHRFEVVDAIALVPRR
jgi:hypothetical protein